MPSQWYCFTDDESGPYSFRELGELIARGELRESDLVRRSESTKWVQVDSVVGLMRTAREVERTSARRKGSGARKGNRQENSWLIKTLAIASICAILCLLGRLSWMIIARPARFPEGPAGGVVMQVPSRLQQMRPVAPVKPSLPQLKPAEPILVPGFENMTWLKSPTLTADMLTIVCVRYAGTESLDDLLIADRKSLLEPFENQRPISSTIRADREAHPTLSADGLQLIFARLGTPTRLWIARRSSRQADFSDPVEMRIAAEGFPDECQDHAQFVNSETIRFTTGDAAFTVRAQLLARRSSQAIPFRTSASLPFPDPWPRYFLAASGKRAYFPAVDGIRMTALATRAKQYLPSEVLLAEEVVGPDLTKYDDTLWVSPQEDVIFFCGPGPARLQEQAHRLWMVRP